MKRRNKIVITVIIGALIVSAIGVIAFINTAKFGKAPSGARLERIKSSPNYEDGAFKNLEPTPVMSPDANFFKVFWEFAFGDKQRNKPDEPIKSVKTDLFALDSNEDVFVWFGHSSYFIRSGGLNILVDPVLSGAASPVPFLVKPFPGADIYRPEDIPAVDYLIITHDHWDHLDYQTVTALKDRISTIVCPLGVGEDFEYWGFDASRIREVDWFETAVDRPEIKIVSVPQRHFSGRSFKRNGTLWSAYVLQCGGKKFFLGGDGGYGKHFEEIGKRYGGFDFAVLECGQYDKNWPYIHTLPRRIADEARDLKADFIIPVHNSKFALANHDWDAPLKEAALGDSVKGLTAPIIGSPIKLDLIRNRAHALSETAVVE